jgi:sulfide:quinone oxidoreductase
VSKTVVVLGGGVGGVVASNVLRKTLPKKHRVVLVDRNDRHNFRSSLPLLLVNKRRPAQISRKLENLRRKGIDFIQAEISQLDTGRRTVETSGGELDYDYLVVSLGAEHHPETVPGMAAGSYNPWSFEGASRLRQKLAAFKRGKIVMFAASLPFTCPPAPYETMFLLDEYFRRRGLRGQVDLTLVTPEPTPEPLAGPKVGDSVRRMLEQRGIELITQARVLSLHSHNGSGSLLLDHGISIPGDLFLGIPPHWGPSVLRDSGLVEEGGWITVDPDTLEARADRVYGIGDAAAVKLPVMKVWAPKAGIFAHYQAEVVGRNIACMIAGEKPRFRYTGKGL